MPTLLPAVPFGRHQALRRWVAVAVAVVMAITVLGATPAPAAAEGVAARGHLLIARDPDGAGNSSDLWLRESGTLEERNLTNGDGATMYGQAVWSPDGAKIAYVKQVKNSDGELVGDVYVMNANGSGVVQVTRDVSDDRDPTWSPDGSKIAYASHQTGKYEIFVAKLGSRTLPSQITPYTLPATGESLDPTWSRDGSQIAFEHRTDAPEIAGPDTENAAHIYRVTLGTDGFPNSLAALTTEAGTDNIDPAYSPDSDHLVFSRDPNTSDTAAAYNIYTRSSAATVTTPPVQVSAPGATKAAVSPQWVPRLSTSAAQRLVYARTLTTTDNELRQIDIAAGTDSFLFASAGDDFEGSFQPMPGCDVVWDGEVASTLGNWADAKNWDTDLVPTATSRVCIPDLKTDEKVILSTATEIASLSTKEDFEVNQFGNLTVGRITTVANKTVSNNGGTLNKAVGGSGVLSGGVFSWTNNNWSELGAWEVAPDATLEFNNNLYNLPAGRTLVNKGLIKLNDARFYNGGQLVNAGSGTIRKLGTVNQDMEVLVDNDGLVSVEAGAGLRLMRGDPNDGTTLASDVGTFQTAEGAELWWGNSTHRLGAGVALKGPGKFGLLYGSTLDVGTNGLAIPGHFYVNTGTLAGSGPLSGGVFHWDSYDYKPLGSWTVSPSATLDFNNYNFVLPTGTRLVNNGLIKLNNAGLYNGGELINGAAGEIRKSGTDARQIENPLNNLGTIRVNEGTLQLRSDATSGTASLYGADGKSLTGGSYVVANAAKLRVPITEFANNQASLVLNGTGALVNTSNQPLMSGLQTNAGRLELRNAAQVTTQTLNSSGTIELSDTSQLTTPALTLNAGGVLRGTGTLVGNVVNEAGTVSPGSPRGTLAVTGSFSQLSGGRLAINVDATGADKLAVTDSATVAGTVDFTVADDAQLTWSDAFTVLAASALTIDPTSVYDLPASPAGIGYRVVPDLAAGDLIFDVRDVVAPDAPAGGPVSSSSGHVDSTWSKTTTVALNNLPAGQDNLGGSGFSGHIVEWVDVSTGTVAANGLTATLPSGKYAVRVKAEDNDGNLSDPTTLTGEYWIDATKPTNVALTAPAAGYSLLTSGKTPQIKATWKAASDTYSGAVTYQLLHRSVAPDSVTWSTRTALAATGTAKTISVKPGYTYCLAVTATDAAGNASTSAERCVGVPMDNVDITAAGKWTTASSTSYYRGSIAKTSAASVTLIKSNVRLKRIALVATTCSTCGSVDVYLGTKKIASVSLVSKTTKHRAVLPVKTYTTLQKAGNVVVKVTSKGRPVMIDAIATSAK